MANSAFLANRNVVINGNMQIAQRATTVASVTGAGYQTCDRWHEYTTGSAGTFTYTQETLSSGNAYADGFQKAYRIDCTTAVAAPAAGVEHYVRQKFEGYNVQQFKKGTANALTYVVSFWVKSNQTGTGICALQDHDNTRYIGGTYTISVADTWEKKTVNFAADATGVMANDNAVSLDVRWYVGAGTTYTSGTLPSAWEATVNANKAAGNAITVGTSTSNDWAITGVQLEIGTTATPYEQKTYGQELADCQRYFQIPYNWWAHSDASTATSFKFVHDFPVEMRAAPTLAAVGTPTVNKMNANAAGPNSITTPGTANKYGFQLSYTTMATGSGSAAATNTPYLGYSGFTADAEL
jgi:hypothetical protein